MHSSAVHDMKNSTINLAVVRHLCARNAATAMLLSVFSCRLGRRRRYISVILFSVLRRIDVILAAIFILAVHCAYMRLTAGDIFALRETYAGI